MRYNPPMLLRRKILLVLAVLAVIGPVGGTVGYGVFLRSDIYRRRVADSLTDFFDLPTTLGRIEPRGLDSSVFRDVDLWLPDRRARVFSCMRAVWSEHHHNGTFFTELDIRDGALVLGSEAWTRSDYRRLLESGLSHNFDELHLREVRLQNIDVTWMRGDLELAVRGARGTIVFEQPDIGRATLTAHTLNGVDVDPPIHITARFNPQNGVTLDDVTLEVPFVEVAALGIDSVLETQVTQGRFRGQVTYAEQGDTTRVDVVGRAEDILLAEFTTRAPTGPITGRIDLTIDDLTIIRGLPRRLRFRGHAREVSLEPLAALLGQPRIEGTGDLIVDAAHIENSRIQQLSIQGHAAGMSLETITRQLGWGTITGRLNLTVNALHVVDNQIRSADIDVIAVPPPDGPGLMDRRFILDTLTALVGLDLGWLADALPEQVEYARLGAKLLVNDGTLRFLGTHGANGETILTIRLANREWAVLDQPALSIQLKPFLDRWEQRASDLDLDDFRRWWGDRQDDTDKDNP